MNYSSGLEYIVGSSYSNSPYSNYSNVNYFSKNLKNQRFLMMIENRFAIYRHVDDNYTFSAASPIIFNPGYNRKVHSDPYKNNKDYLAMAAPGHSFAPELFLNPSRPKSQFVGDNNEARGIAEEIFELMTNEKLDDGISITILPLDDFKAVHSLFGLWSSGILGFSINGAKKEIFAMSNKLDELMIVIGHEIGHVLTETLPNKHDEEAKAFAFSLEWAKTIKKHNVAGLGLSIKDELDFHPARNGLHDVAFGFVDFMLKKGRKAMDLHRDLVKQYISVFDMVY